MAQPFVKPLLDVGTWRHGVQGTMQVGADRIGYACTLRVQPDYMHACIYAVHTRPIVSTTDWCAPETRNVLTRDHCVTNSPACFLGVLQDHATS